MRMKQLGYLAAVAGMALVGCGPVPQQQQPTIIVQNPQPVYVQGQQPTAQPVAVAPNGNAGSGLQIGGSTANFGSTRISPGFTPDPMQVSVVSGGAIDARGLGLGAGCVGWLTRQPDYIVHLSGNSPNFRIYANSSTGEDTTLVINGANGQWYCNDDSYGTRDPSVDLSGAAAGQYDVWVGSYQQGTQARATLNLTELSNNHPGGASPTYAAQPTTPAASGGTLAVGGTTANYGMHNLSPGFVPDPQPYAVVAGGSIDARTVGIGAGCVGWVTRQPDLIVNLTGSSRNIRLYAVAQNGQDVTLLVNSGSGQWYCNDDSYGGRNPSVDVSNAPPGRYDVWLGSYQQGTQAQATIYVTELMNNHP